MTADYPDSTDEKAHIQTSRSSRVIRVIRGYSRNQPRAGSNSVSVAASCLCCFATKR